MKARHVSSLCVYVALAMPFAARAAGIGNVVTFTRDIAPIFQKNCQSCHHPGTSAPMSLMTYLDARPWAKSIKQKVVTRDMPPWHLEAHSEHEICFATYYDISAQVPKEFQDSRPLGRQGQGRIAGARLGPGGLPAQALDLARHAVAVYQGHTPARP